MMRFFFFVFLSALWACTAPSTDDNSDDHTGGGQSHPGDDPIDNSSTDGVMTVRLTIPTLLDGAPEPCLIQVQSPQGQLTEGWSDEEIVLNSAKIGDELVVYAGGSFVQMTQATSFTNLDPPGDRGFPLHEVAGGGLAISLPRAVAVTDAQMELDPIQFHRYATGVWTLATIDLAEYFSTDEVKTYYVEDPVTGDRVFMVSWASGWRATLNGSTYGCFGESGCAEGAWDDSSTITLRLHEGDFDQTFTAFPGYESDDPRLE